MATGITIDEVTNTLDDIQGTEKIPVSSGISEPEVVTTGTLKEYINDGMQEEISDLSTIRSGASAGATAYQKPSSGIPSTDLASAVQTSLGKADTALQSFTETDPTVPSWAKASSKPSYSASEVGAVPTTRKINNKALSADVTLSANDVGALPSDTPLFSGSYDDLTNKPDIPDSLSDLSDDSTHRVVTDTEKSTWSAKSDFSGSYNDLTDKPTIPAAQVQSDWSESDNTKVDYIKNKPTLGVGSSSGAVSSSTVVGIPAGGNAGQVLYKVDGSTNYSVGWTNQTTNYPSAYCTTSGSTAAKKASCTLYAAQANSYLHVLIGSNNTSASALTLNVNSEGAKPIYINGTASSATNYTLPKGTYIVFYDGTNYYFRTDGKIQAPNGTLVSTSSTSGLIKNDGTIDTTTYISDVSGKADKSEMSVTTSGDQTTITLKSGTSATVINQHQSLSGYVQTSSTTGLIKNDGTIDTTSYGTYSKPSGGIPAADLASGVIPTVPTISTDISSDATSDTKTTSPKAVKTFVEGKGYTTNTGTITSVKMNGSTVASSGEADLGTVITSETSLSLGSTSGSGNAVTDLSVSGHTITMTKGSTFLTSHQDISGKEDTSNKVTSLSSSSTDTQYPSAKATYTYINTMLGDIETLLSNI